MAQQPTHSMWRALRRPLMVAFLFGCAISLMTSGRLSLRLILSTAIFWSFVPLLQIAALAVVWPWRRSQVSFATAIDRFFLSQTPWSILLCLFAGMWAFFPTAKTIEWIAAPGRFYYLALAVALWTACLDYRFFRAVSERTPARAIRDLAVLRAIVWPVGLAWFVAVSGWQVVATKFGL